MRTKITQEAMQRTEASRSRPYRTGSYIPHLHTALAVPAGSIVPAGLTGLGLFANMQATQIPAFASILLWLGSLPFTIYLIVRIFDTYSSWVERWGQVHFQALKLSQLEIKLPRQVTNLMLLAVGLLRAVTIALVTSVGLLLALDLFPQTHSLVQGLLIKGLELLGSLSQRVLAALPGLAAVITIAVLTYYTLRLLQTLSDGFKEGKVKLAGLHPDLVEPTMQILRFLVVCLALVAAYPYIPGSGSPAFRYISIFIGFLLSLGSTSLVSNIVAGIVLIYMRGMRIGDRVQIADTVGDVVSRTLLVTRIRTIKNVIITIPNGLVLNSHIINFSASAEKTGLILNTCVTIGYDVPWRQVHTLLVEAARATRHITPEPEPFVLQTSLNDYYVTYELNATTRQPGRMASIYSELHQNIQDYFNAAGVEILSPAYSAHRDGSASTIPTGHVPLGDPALTYQPGNVLQSLLGGIALGAKKGGPSL